MRYIVYLLALPFLLISCESKDSADVNQSQISISYNLSYNAKVDKTTAQAYFSFGTQALQLTAPSSIVVNDQKLNWQDLPNYYMYEFNGFVTNGIFVWTNTTRNVYTNTLKLVPISIASVPDKIDSAKNFSVTWQGASIAEGEWLHLNINLVNLGLVGYDTIIHNDLGSKTIIIPGAILAPYTKGTAKVELTRKASGNLKEKTQEDCIWETAYTDSKTIAN